MHLNLPDGRRIDLTRHVLSGPDGEASLTQLECDAIRFLAAAAGEVVPRRSLERDVWGFRAGTRSEAVPVAMRRLRAKIGDALFTVRGVGWRLDAEAAAPDPSASAVRLPRLPQSMSPWMPRPTLQSGLEALHASGRRRIAVVGPRGIGCSRLVQETLRPHDPVYIVLGEGPLDGSALLEALAQTFGLTSSDRDPVLQALAACGAPLLVLDGAQQLEGDGLDVVQAVARVCGVVCTLEVAPADPAGTLRQESKIPEEGACRGT